MLAGELAKKSLCAVTNNNANFIGVTENSKEVKEGFVFAALKGANLNGEDFIADAMGRGATALLIDKNSPLLANDEFIKSFPLPLFISGNARLSFTLMAKAFYPLLPSVITAVTGTNGKTSTTVFCRQIWERAGFPSASMGTIGIVSKVFNEEGNLTSPPPAILYRNVNKLAALGINHLSLEASSHGIHQNRLDGLKISAAAFTNLTRDHLDYHKTMENYLQAKLRLFTEILTKDGTAVLNADIPEAETITNEIKKQGINILTYGFFGKDLKILAHRMDSFGQNLLLEVLGKTYNIRLPLSGDFQAMNALAAAGLAISTGVEADEVVSSLEYLKGACGRLENVATLSNKASVYVDYAHTPDAIDNVLRVLRPITKGKLHILFGCGGDRDRGKRPQMGKIAAALADEVIVTDDNPRTEDADFIRSEIMPACPDALEIGDRCEAIRTAVSRLGSEDVLVLAGKGHETGQKIGIKVYPFSDTDEAIRAVREIDPNAITGSANDDSVIWQAGFLAHIIGGVGKEALAKDFAIYGIKSSIKEVKVGDAFLSLDDNEDDIVAAFSKGARVAIVQRKPNKAGKITPLYLITDNTETALDRMAKHKRQPESKIVISLFKSGVGASLRNNLERELIKKGRLEIIKDKSGDITDFKIAFANLKDSSNFIIVEHNNVNTQILPLTSTVAKADIIVIQTEDKLGEDVQNILIGANAGAKLFIDSARSDFVKLSETAKLCGLRKVIPFHFTSDKSACLSKMILDEMED